MDRNFRSRVLWVSCHEKRTFRSGFAMHELRIYRRNRHFLEEFKCLWAETRLCGGAGSHEQTVLRPIYPVIQPIFRETFLIYALEIVSFYVLLESRGVSSSHHNFNISITGKYLGTPIRYPRHFIYNAHAAIHNLFNLSF